MNHNVKGSGLHRMKMNRDIEAAHTHLPGQDLLPRRERESVRALVEPGIVIGRGDPQFLDQVGLDVLARDSKTLERALDLLAQVWLDLIQQEGGDLEGQADGGEDGPEGPVYPNEDGVLERVGQQGVQRSEIER